ncbi:MAG: nuclear transport factor 2 family protein [Phycisphaerae bacterium]|nr:nuclear transport factor 2 family protein [Phycisphaerae bacterium]
MFARLSIIGTVVAIMSAAAFASVRESRTLKIAPTKELRYEVVLPDGFDPAKPAPTMLLLPPGGQDKAMVEAALKFVETAAVKRGWVVVCPEAIEREPFTDAAGQRHLDPLMKAVKSSMKVEGDRPHVAGISNGGRSAMLYASEHPADCRSVLVFPGAFPRAIPSQATLAKLSSVPVRMIVGGRDDVSWREAGTDAVTALKKAGVDATLEVRAGQGHVIQDLSGDAIFDTLDAFRPSHAAIATNDDTAVRATLDALHDAASKHDEDRYFALFAPNAVFIGTDATERWTLAEFRAYAHPIFAADKGWTYVSKSRHVDVDAAAGYAFFDELLDNAKYGESRGTGVLKRVGGTWKIAQYHLTVPVPNAMLEDVAKAIKAKAQ